MRSIGKDSGYTHPSSEESFTAFKPLCFLSDRRSRRTAPCSSCQHFTQLRTSPLPCRAAEGSPPHKTWITDTPTSSSQALLLCWVTVGGAVEGRRQLHKWTSCNEMCHELLQSLLLIVVNEVTETVCVD